MGRSASQQRANAELLRSIWRRLSPPTATALVWDDSHPYADHLSWPLLLETPEGPLEFQPRWHSEAYEGIDQDEYNYEDGSCRGVEVDFGMDEVAWDASDQHPYRLVLRRPGENYPDEDHLPLDMATIRAMSDEQVSDELARVLRALRAPGLAKSMYVASEHGWGRVENLGEGPAEFSRYSCLLENQFYLGHEYLLRLSRSKAPDGAAWAVWRTDPPTLAGLVGYLDDSYEHQDPADWRWVERRQRPWPNPLKLCFAYMPEPFGPYRVSVDVSRCELDGKDHLVVGLAYPEQ